MRPSVLLSLALAGGLASAQFITSVIQEQPSTTDLVALELRAVKDATTSTSDEETTTTSAKKTTTTAAAKTTTTPAKDTTTTTPAKTTATTGRTTSTSHTTSDSKTTVTSTSTVTSGGGGAASDTPTDTDRGGAAAASTTASGNGSGSGSNGGNGNGNGNSNQSKGLSAGAAAGIAVGSVVGALAIAGAGFFVWRRRKGGVRGAVVTADYPPMSDPFSRPGPREPTLPSVSPGPSGPSHPPSMGSSAGPYSTISSPTAGSSTAYSNSWLGNSAVAYAAPHGGNGYRPVGYDEHAEFAPTQRNDSYQRLLPTEEVSSPQIQNHDRYERISLEEAGTGFSHGGSQQEDQHSNLPSFMIPGGMARKASLPGGQPVPTIALQAASPIPATSRAELPGRNRIELPG
ncbi:hypothetical protein GQ53DRAFT_828828 [Thozetella sp. PMI_491]|nr:hypothetical protein GQ53DRAFT_828828 [Thozetella sp. PMI_491]